MLRQKNEAGAAWLARQAIKDMASRGLTPWTASLREDDLGQAVVKTPLAQSGSKGLSQP
jgi:hypothetical protein